MAAVKKASEKDWGPRSESEILRLAAEIGLAVLAEVNYDVDRIVARFALNSDAKSPAEVALETFDQVEKAEAARPRGPRRAAQE